MENDNENLPKHDIQTVRWDPSEIPTSSGHALNKSLKRSREQESEENFPDLKSLRLDPVCKDRSESTTNPMASASSINLDSSIQASDKNCKKSCGLQYGISDVFAQMVLEQQKLKASKSHIKPQTFDEPNDQKIL